MNEKKIKACQLKLSLYCHDFASVHRIWKVILGEIFLYLLPFFPARQPSSTFHSGAFVFLAARLASVDLEKFKNKHDIYAYILGGRIR
jgi:hypothetical protein